MKTAMLYITCLLAAAVVSVILAGCADRDADYWGRVSVAYRETAR